MTRITGDDFMLISLHKMAAERGDGLIPEMIELLRRSGDTVAGGFDRSAGIVPFPRLRNEPLPVSPASNENNIIAFPIARRRAMRR